MRMSSAMRAASVEGSVRRIGRNARIAGAVFEAHREQCKGALTFGLARAYSWMAPDARGCSGLCDTPTLDAATHNVLDFRHDRSKIAIAALHKTAFRCTPKPRPGASNVRNPGTTPSGPKGQRGIAPRRSECPVRRVREAGEHQRERRQERFRRLDRQ